MLLKCGSAAANFFQCLSSPAMCIDFFCLGISVLAFAQTELRQWAIDATASSEYSSSSWSAKQATGAPDTTSCGDIPTAWAPSSGGADPEWIEVTYATPVHATMVRVHETNPPGTSGFIYQIDVRDTHGNLHTVWTGSDTTPCPGWFETVISKTPFLVTSVKIYTQISGWEEIDAVELIGESITIPPTKMVTYKYDRLNRLIEVRYEDGTTITYTYDAAGNRLTLQITD